MMKYILCYGDSNTWGASPDQLPRFGFETRWPGADCVHLTAGGHSALGEAVAARAREILKL